MTSIARPRSAPRTQSLSLWRWRSSLSSLEHALSLLLSFQFQILPYTKLRGVLYDTAANLGTIAESALELLSPRLEHGESVLHFTCRLGLIPGSFESLLASARGTARKHGFASLDSHPFTRSFNSTNIIGIFGAICADD